MLWVRYLSLILFNTLCGIYSIPKESKFKAVFLSINNEIHYTPLLFLLLKFMPYAPSFILGKSISLKNIIKARFEIEILINLDIS